MEKMKKSFSRFKHEIKVFFKNRCNLKLKWQWKYKEIKVNDLKSKNNMYKDLSYTYK